MDATQKSIAEIGSKLYVLNVFPHVHAWINFQIKRRANSKAVLYALETCLKEKPVNPWAWCEIVIRKAGPKANARDFEAKAREDKNGFIELVDALKQFMGKRDDFYKENLPF